MKNFILIVAVSFLRLLDFSGAEPCTTPVVTDCLTKPKRANDQKIQIGVLFSGTCSGDKCDETENLIDYVCAVKSKLPNTVTMVLMVGATVTTNENGIDCSVLDCYTERLEACILMRGDTSTNCDTQGAKAESVNKCINKKNSDETLKYSSTLRCNLGIDVANIPAVVIDQKFYDPCAKFNCEEDVLSFICSFYDGLSGC